jgi:hypothetical protein
MIPTEALWTIWWRSLVILWRRKCMQPLFYISVYSLWRGCLSPQASNSDDLDQCIERLSRRTLLQDNSGKGNPTKKSSKSNPPFPLDCHRNQIGMYDLPRIFWGKCRNPPDAVPAWVPYCMYLPVVTCQCHLSNMVSWNLNTPRRE